jgi:hypothetical protein
MIPIFLKKVDKKFGKLIIISDLYRVIKDTKYETN